MNSKLIQDWIEANEPQGQAKLAARAEISTGTIVKIVRDGHEPGVDIARRIARVIGVSLDVLAGGVSSDDAPPAA